MMGGEWKRFQRSVTWSSGGKQSGTGAVLPAAEVESSVPARPASFTADVLVPLVQALITGGLLAGALTLFVAAFTAYRGNLLALWGGGTLLLTAGAWLLLLSDTRKLLWAVERLVGQDLDGDRRVGKPEERLVIVNAERARQDSRERADAVRRSEFARFVAALPMRGTSQRAWESEIGREAWASYRDALLRLGWARWNSYKRDRTPNETKGWSLTVEPEEILRRIQ